MTNRVPRQFIVYWLAQYNGLHRGYLTQQYHSRYKDFDCQDKAEKFFELLTSHAENCLPYQRRIPSHVTKNF